MKLLWLCNMMPGLVREQVNSKGGSGLWLDHVLNDMLQQPHRLHILCPNGSASGSLTDRCSYRLFTKGAPHAYSREQEELFLRELTTYEPDVIHIWGTEYSHTLAMVNACRRLNMVGRVVISIQGLCSVYADHYCEGLPVSVQKKYTLRDFLRQDNILQQKKAFEKRGRLELEALRQVRHVIGRTDWDRACTHQINPDARYHTCCETLRTDFYEGSWSYQTCRKHRVFASSCAYPVKGFHYLLQAFAQLCKDYPDAVLAVTGDSYLTANTLSERIRKSSYQLYLTVLTRKYHLENHVEFLGKLSAREMKEQYLLANAFALPSTIENSPNSLGEAMLLGVPCVASLVGGTATMLKDGQEGFLYQSTAPYMLAHYLSQVFRMGEGAESLGKAAAAHAHITHDPEKNLQDLLGIYEEVRMS